VMLLLKGILVVYDCVVRTYSLIILEVETFPFEITLIK
jgi:hypothetical protein